MTIDKSSQKTDSSILFHEIGRLSVYCAYLEDKLFIVIKNLKKNKYELQNAGKQFQLSRNAKAISEILSKLDLDEFNKQNLLKVLKQIENIAKERNKFIHSFYRSNRNGDVFVEDSNLRRFPFKVKEITKVADKAQKLHIGLTTYLTYFR